MSEIKTLRNQIERLKGERSQIQKSITQLTDGVKESNRDLRRHEQAGK